MELRQARLEMDMTQQELAGKLAARGLPMIDGPMISKFESGVCLPNRETTEALEDILQIQMPEFLVSPEEECGECNKAAEPRISPLSALVLSQLETGKANGKSREALCAVSGIKSDRNLRKCIQELRGAGIIILNDQDGRGYYISKDLNDMERQYRQDTARALSILRRRSTIRKILKQAGRPV